MDIREINDISEGRDMSPEMTATVKLCEQSNLSGPVET